MSSTPAARDRRTGWTLIELTVVVALVLAGLALLGPWILADKFALARAGRLAESHLVRARLHAVAGHGRTSVQVTGQALELRDAAGVLISRIDLDRGSFRALDSLRLRPRTLRFNARGQGAAGSIYLYRGRRGIRVLSNFVGRIRRTRFRF